MLLKILVLILFIYLLKQLSNNIIKSKSKKKSTDNTIIDVEYEDIE